MIRTIAPHDTLDDAAYALVVSAVDPRRGGFGGGARRSFAPALRVWGKVLPLCRRNARVLHLKAIESCAFFGLFDKNLMVLYSKPIAWRTFGYEGESFSKGGYLLRRLQRSEVASRSAASR